MRESRIRCARALGMKDLRAFFSIELSYDTEGCSLSLDEISIFSTLMFLVPPPPPFTSFLESISQEF